MVGNKGGSKMIRCRNDDMPCLVQDWKRHGGGWVVYLFDDRTVYIEDWEVNGLQGDFFQLLEHVIIPRRFQAEGEKVQVVERFPPLKT